MESRAAAREIPGMVAYFAFGRAGPSFTRCDAEVPGEFGAGGDGSWAAQRFSPLER